MIIVSIAIFGIVGFLVLAYPEPAKEPQLDPELAAFYREGFQIRQTAYFDANMRD